MKTFTINELLDISEKLSDAHVKNTENITVKIIEKFNIPRSEAIPLFCLLADLVNKQNDLFLNLLKLPEKQEKLFLKRKEKELGILTRKEAISKIIKTVNKHPELKKIAKTIKTASNEDIEDVYYKLFKKLITVVKDHG